MTSYRPEPLTRKWWVWVLFLVLIGLIIWALADIDAREEMPDAPFESGPVDASFTWFSQDDGTLPACC